MKSILRALGSGFICSVMADFGGAGSDSLIALVVGSGPVGALAVISFHVPALDGCGRARFP